MAKDSEDDQAQVPDAEAAGAALPFTRVFLTLGQSSYAWRVYVVLNVELTGSPAPGSDDYLALNDQYPTGPKDYLSNQWQEVSKLQQGSFETGTWCGKTNGNLTVGDLDLLSKYYVFYVGTDANDDYVIEGSPASYLQQPHWMRDSLPAIGQKWLHEIVIPGAHDTGTYDVMSKEVNGNAQAQNLDFAGQLALGVRYFDCRIWNVGGSTPFRFYHGTSKSTWTYLSDLTSALTSFFNSAIQSKDVVILDFCRLKDFNQASVYAALFAHFTQNPLFAPLLISPDEARRMTLNDLAARGKRLLILCEDAATHAPQFAESINLDAQWAETSSLADLKQWLDNQVSTNGGADHLWSLQAILTPPDLNWLFPYADEVNHVLRRWVVANPDPAWWYYANVVFCDFTGGSDLVHAAKVCNQRRYDPNKGDLHWFAQPDWRNGGPVVGGQQIDPNGWLACKSAFATSEGVIYTVKWDGSLWRCHDRGWPGGNGPVGDHSLASPAGSKPGERWCDYRFVFATSDGVIYAIGESGELWRYRDADWKTGAGSMPFDSRQFVSGRGQLSDWTTYRSAFATSEGTIYVIDGDGVLWRYRDTAWRSGDQRMPFDSREQAGTGWLSMYKSVFATGEGVIYGADWFGNLNWYADPHWKQGSGVIPGPYKTVSGPGWCDHRMVFASSEGVIYAVDP